MGAPTDGTRSLPPEGLKRLPATLPDADSYRKAAYEFLAVGEGRPDWEPELQHALVYVLGAAEPADAKARKYRKRWLDQLLRVGWMGYALVISEDWSGLDADHGRALLAAGDDELLRRMDAAAWSPETKYWWHDQIAARVKGIWSHYEPYDEIRSYLFAFPAAQRVATFATWAVVPTVVEVRVPWGRAKLWDEAARYAWESGAIIGMLDLLGAFRPGFSSVELP
jgi:hypothetical protein